MKGFDNHFENLTDYILKITYQIWEQKDVESIRKYYSDSIPVRSPSGVIIGPEPVVKATYATLNEFPDRQLLGEDVIWIGNDQEGYFSSHRILTRASHLKDGLYGKASNKKIIVSINPKYAANVRCPVILESKFSKLTKKSAHINE